MSSWKARMALLLAALLFSANLFPMSVLAQDPFVDPGATAGDTLDGQLTDHLQVTGAPLDTTQVGRYTVSYRVADAGNVVEATRLVEVAPPATVTVEEQLYLPIILPRNQSK
jgi:hypothetical protein